MSDIDLVTPSINFPFSEVFFNNSESVPVTMRFEVKLGNEVVGFSELEGGDAPMGVALGRLTPTPAYASIQPYCIEHRDHWVNISGLTVETPSGVPIECSGGIQIIDLSLELGEAGIQIHLNGVTDPPYNELFPQHVDAYKKQFR